jgi:hypothetical protein
MKLFAALLACAALAVNSGCCCSRMYSPCGNACGYSPAMSAPMMSPGCPNGNCGAMYPSGAMVPSTQSAYMPYTTTASLDYLPAF